MLLCVKVSVFQLVAKGRDFLTQCEHPFQGNSSMDFPSLASFGSMQISILQCLPVKDGT